MSIGDSQNPLDKAMETMGCSRETKLIAALRKKINNEIFKLLKPTYFRRIPLGDIVAVLKKHHVVMLQEDNTEWAGLLCGEDERAVIELADEDTFLPIGKVKMYVPYTNAMLILSWFRMPSGNYEVLCYVS